jgi:hypothetical protein
MRRYHPVAETNIQIMGPDKESGSVPVADHYYLGRLDLSDAYQERFYLDAPSGVSWKSKSRGLEPGATPHPAGKQRNADITTAPPPVAGIVRSEVRNQHQFSTMRFMPLGFAAMIFPDARGFDRNSYNFEFLRRVFLGDIWVEDHGYIIVRFNGIFQHPGAFGRYFHMDSWRENVIDGLWLPSVIYSEEPDVNDGRPSPRSHLKAQTQLWRYDLSLFRGIVEGLGLQIKLEGDTADATWDFSPIGRLRSWQHQAENNVLARLEQAGLLAPAGPIDHILEQIVVNVEESNSLDLQPDVRCRVLLTSLLESASIGHTIVISRGLLDVLTDEASVAVVLAHELAHIAGGEEVDTRYSFSDRMVFADEESFQRFRFARSPEQEQDADKRALELLKNSMYEDKLRSSGLFLRELKNRGAGIPNLTRAHLGNGFTDDTNITRMSELMNYAPELKIRDLSQLAAQPLGARVRVNSWDGKIELLKSKVVAPDTPSEKMPFQVVPTVINLTRLKPWGTTDTAP